MLAKVVSGPPWVECEPAVVPTVARTVYIDVQWFGRVDSKPVRSLRTSTACKGCGGGRTSFVDAKGPRELFCSSHSRTHSRTPLASSYPIYITQLELLCLSAV
jgi:hypothetical protein